MMKLRFSSFYSGIVFVAVTLFVIVVLSSLTLCNAIGHGSTLAVSYGSATVCGVVASERTQRIQCYRGGEIIPVDPDISYSSISGGRDFFCGLRSSGYSFLCWDTVSSSTNFKSKRLYNNATVRLEYLSVGEDHLCATAVGTGTVECWRGDEDFELPSEYDQFASISSGSGFSCGILKNSSRVRCWGDNDTIMSQIQKEFDNMPMLSIVAGYSHVCGLNITGFLVCKGSNGSGQLDVPPGGPMEYTGLSLGAEHSCAIRSSNYSVVCWGGGGQYSVNAILGLSFELIASGLNFTCGLIARNFSVICWGPGWSTVESSSNQRSELPLNPILPGPCLPSSCSECGIYPKSQDLCSGSNSICKPCLPKILGSPGLPNSIPLVPLSPTFPPSSTSRSLRWGLLAFAIVGSVGALAGLCTLMYCFWSGICFGKKKVHNSAQPTIAREASSNGGPASSSIRPTRSSSIRRQSSRIIRRQRSGTSSKHADRAEEFSLAELATATNNFSIENKIGAGSYGVVYRGKLSDGREVAIKRGETAPKMEKFQEKENAFDSELAFLSRLHHKHLVRLVGFCEEKDERLLVYEYMKHGALYDHLHDKKNVHKSSEILNSWQMRIRIALGAARGIEYLHYYAVPPIIHRDIKSSNILLDLNWTARVSDFGLSLLFDHDDKPLKAAGTVGYIDPEYYSLNVLTAKSDAYGLGIVLLELLTGKRAIFKSDETEGMLMSLVDFSVPAINSGELVKILDPRVGPPELNLTEAVELVAYTALHCVNLEGKDRPTMAEIVANLERALDLCDDSHGRISSGSGTFFIVSERKYKYTLRNSIESDDSFGL